MPLLKTIPQTVHKKMKYNCKRDEKQSYIIDFKIIWEVFLVNSPQEGALIPSQAQSAFLDWLV